MRHLLDFECDRRGCERPLTDDELRLIYREGATERRVYECRCGAVTVTVGRRGAT